MSVPGGRDTIMCALAQVSHMTLPGRHPVALGGPVGRVHRWVGRWAARSALLALPFFVSAASAAQAEPTPPLKIGVLDIGIIFQEYRQIPVIEAQLKAEIGRYEELVEARRSRVETLERAARAPGRRFGATRPTAQDLAQARAALRDARREANEELGLLEEQATAVVLANVRRAAEAEAAAQELDLVLDRTDASLLFVRARAPFVVDVTAAVLARLQTQ